MASTSPICLCEVSGSEEGFAGRLCIVPEALGRGQGRIPSAGFSVVQGAGPLAMVH